MEDKDLTTQKADSEVAKELTEENSQAKNIAEAQKEERTSMPYITASSCNPIGTVVPTKLAYETIEALGTFINNGVDTTEFVRDKLGYVSKIAVCDSFSSEQVDGLALAIKQIEQGKGFILGDMAGIGKGRICAGIGRYAKMQGKIPVFLTISPTLFSDHYRDIVDIGGYGESDSLKFTSPLAYEYWQHLPKPFILNEKDGTAPIVIQLNHKVGADEVPEVLFTPYKTKLTVQMCGENRGSLPNDKDLVMLTYSQLSQDVENVTNVNAREKLEYLKSIAPNSIFILDESHKGAGDGNIGQNIYEILTLSFGVMFASATYSKTPESMMLYIPKTDINDSNIRPTTIVNAVAQNGEVVQEYVASMLVKSGQMIRRQQTYDKCEINFKYIGLSEKEKYYKLYDDVMSLYNKIDNFSKSSLYKKAVEKAIIRMALERKIELVDPNDKEIPTEPQAKREWQEKNKNKYYVEFNTTNIVSSRFQWIESLLFSMKAQVTAESVIEQLKPAKTKDKLPEVEYYDGKNRWTEKTNHKPVVAVRNTGESALIKLGYKIGDVLTPEQNDYAKTLINIAESLIASKLIFRPVNDSRKPIIIEKDVARVIDLDFEDNGVKYNAIVDEMKTATSGIPLSPIDYMIDKIESTYRADWDDEYSDSPTYKVEEITKRKLMVKHTIDIGDVVTVNTKDGSGKKTSKSGIVKEKVKEGYKISFDGFVETYPANEITSKYVIVSASSENQANKVSRFNNGKSDVIFINTAGSTGISLHSKSDFVDRRPRVMLIQQVELDVATEVQKRGRIYRTGQVNFPAYTYIVSTIPSEIRKLMMMRRKLRSLDANTTGNVKQSAKASQILDANGKEIEDMSNKFGWRALKDFLEEADNTKYASLLDEKKAKAFHKNPNKFFTDFLLEIEKIPCGDDPNNKDKTNQRANQEEFYDKMNTYYKVLMDRLIEAEEWDLETTIEDLKSSTMNKKVAYHGNNSNEFTKSVYIEDKHITSRGKPYSKEEVMKNVISLAQDENFQESHRKMVDEFDTYVESEIAGIIEDENVKLLVKLENAQTQEEKDEITKDHEEALETKKSESKIKFNNIKNILNYFFPTKMVLVPIDVQPISDNCKDENGNYKLIERVAGRFIGYKFLSKTGKKFSPMNVELQFSAPSKRRPHLKLTLTKQFSQVLEWIMNNRVSTTEKTIVETWIINKNEREKMRVLTGEIFKAFEIANELVRDERNDLQSKKRLIKFSTVAGTIETGIRMWQKGDVYKDLTTGKPTPTYITLDNEVVLKNFQTMKSGSVFWLPTYTEYFEKVNTNLKYRICNGFYMHGGKRIKTPSNKVLSQFMNQSFIEDLKNKTGVSFKSETIEQLIVPIKGGEKNYFNIEFVTFDVDPSKLQRFLEVLAKKTKLIITLQGGEEYIIRYDESTGVGKDAWTSEQTQEGKEGEYQYFLERDLKDYSDLPANYIEDSFVQDNESPFGIITLKYPLNVMESAIYKVIPANITELQAVVNILNTVVQVKGDDGMLKFVDDVKALKDDYDAIGDLTLYTTAVPPKYAIGMVDNYYAGSVIAEHIDQAKERATRKKDETATVKVIKDSKEKIPLDWSTAQEFIIKLKKL